MSDMLVKLYELEDDWSFLAEQEKLGITIRKPIGPEKHLIVDWVREKFSDAWASETDMAISNRPVSCFVAVKDGALIGFACYDATAIGFFGPIGVEEASRGRGTGRALLLACMLDMKLKGYVRKAHQRQRLMGYAVIGSTTIFEFYRKNVGAVVIPDSSPGLWKTWLKRRKHHG